MSKTRADTALFTLPFRALVARCFGSVKAPSPVVIITVAGKRSAVSDWHSKWPFCQGGDSDMSSAQADTHLKPSQFNEAQRVDSNKSCLSPLPSQNRFQALLDEIIQQEEREMEQVRNFCVKKAVGRCSLRDSYSFQHFARIYLVKMSSTMLADGVALLKSNIFLMPFSKVQTQSCEM